MDIIRVGSGRPPLFLKEGIEREGSFTKKDLDRNDNANIQHILRENRCYLTGSRAWDKASYDSDWDYITDAETYSDIIDTFVDEGVKYIEHPIYKSIYVRDMHREYNIICLSSMDLQCWKFATKAMKGMVQTNTFPKSFFEDKNKVYGMFENLKMISRFVEVQF